MKHVRKVISVSRCPIRLLPPVVFTSDNTARLLSTSDWERLCIKVPAELSITTKTEDKARLWTAKLTFTTPDDSPIRERYAWLCTLADGSVLLIGTDKRPFPVVETAHTISSKSDSTSELPEVTVTYTSPRPLPYVTRPGVV